MNAWQWIGVVLMGLGLLTVCAGFCLFLVWVKRQWDEMQRKPAGPLPPYLRNYSHDEVIEYPPVPVRNDVVCVPVGAQVITVGGGGSGGTGGGAHGYGGGGALGAPSSTIFGIAGIGGNYSRYEAWKKLGHNALCKCDQCKEFWGDKNAS